MFTMTSKLMGSNDELSRDQYEITIYRDGEQVGLLECEYECGSYLSPIYEEGEVPDISFLNEVNQKNNYSREWVHSF